MFNTLLESRRRRQRSILSATLSAALHVLIVTGAIYATATGSEPVAPPADAVTYAAFKPKADPPPPVPADAPPPPATTVPAPRKGFQTLSAPISIPDVLPPLGLFDPVVNPADFVPRDIPGGFANGAARDDSTAGDEVRFSFEVEKVARLAPGNPEPVYPSLMKQAGKTGSVRVSLVIDTTGRADPQSIRIIESTSELFTAEVRRVLSRYRFIPAEIGGRKVRMLAELPFDFKLTSGK